MEASDEEEWLESLLKGEDLLTEGSKHLLMANHYGWTVVEAYVDNPLASDSEDENKIRCAIKESKNVEQRQGLRKTEGKDRHFVPLAAHP